MTAIIHPISRLVRAFLIEQGVGYAYNTSVDWSVAVVAEPKAPINCITVYDESQQIHSRPHSGIWDNYVVSIRVRSANQLEGHKKAQAILSAMDGVSNWMWAEDSSDAYAAYAADGQTVTLCRARRNRGVFAVGCDENNRWVFDLEYAIVIKSVA